MASYTSFAPAVIVLAGITYTAPAPELALALTKSSVSVLELHMIILRYTLESAAKFGGRVSLTVTPLPH